MIIVFGIDRSYLICRERKKVDNGNLIDPKIVFNSKIGFFLVEKKKIKQNIVILMWIGVCEEIKQVN